MTHPTSIDILNMLVDAGLDRAKAEPLAKEILTRAEAKETLATKADLEAILHSQTKWIAVLMLGQFIATIAALGGLIAYVQ